VIAERHSRDALSGTVGELPEALMEIR